VLALQLVPGALHYSRLPARALGDAITDAVTRHPYRDRDRAQEPARRLASEDGASPVIKAIDSLQPVGCQNCVNGL
jgi:hypothetical protein